MDVQDLWEKVGKKYIMDPIMSKSNRKNELSWKTVYNKLSRANVFCGEKKGKKLFLIVSE